MSRSPKSPERISANEIAGPVMSTKELLASGAVFDSAGHAVITTDADCVIRGFNAAAERLTGYRVRELSGKSTPEILHDPAELAQRCGGEEPSGFLALAARARGGEDRAQVWTYRRKDKGLFPVLLTVTAMREEGGHVSGFVCLAIDVTEQHRAQQQLAHERAALERVARMEALEDVLDSLVRGHEALYPGTLGSVFLLDETGRRLCPGAAPNLPPDYTRALDGVEIGPFVGSCGTAAFLRKTVIAADIATDVHWANFTDLALKYSLRACWSTPILSGRGKVLGTFALYYKEPRGPEKHELTAIESSARIAAIAIERSRAVSDLEQFAERLELATRSAQIGIFDFDVARDRLDWDEQMFSIYGVDQASFKGGYQDWRRRVHPDDLHLAEIQLTVAIEGDLPFETSFRIVRPDGETRFIQAASIMQRDSSGRATRMIGVNIDVTAKKLLETQLLRSQRLESVGRFAGGIAHDLNNMLAPMLVGPSMLREHVTDNEATGLLDLIESSAQRAASVIRQLLTFSRGVDQTPAPLDCGAVVGDMLRLIAKTFPPEIRASRGGIDGPWTAIADATQLHQVLMNLCVNARDEMPNGGTLILALENVEVGVELARAQVGVAPGRFVAISVIDTGRGIDPANMERLFEPFFSTKDVGRGTGLGLATVLGIVQAHAGFIEIQSKLGQGTTFKVHLPATSLPVSAPEVKSPASLPRGRGQRILVVDDEEPIRRLIEAILKRQGYGVLLAASGNEALEIHRERGQTIDLILSDLTMPGTDGAELIRRIRDVDPTVKLIVMSGNLGANKSYAAISSLVQGALEKPFSMEVLLRELNAALEI